MASEDFASMDVYFQPKTELTGVDGAGWLGSASHQLGDLGRGSSPF